MIAWSTPGAAVLAVAGASGGFGMAEATGAFIVCAALIIAGRRERRVRAGDGQDPDAAGRRPCSPACWRASASTPSSPLASAPGLVLAMLAAYLLGRRLWPRYAVVGVLAVGIAIAAATGRLHAGRRAMGVHRAGVHRARVQLAGDGEPGPAALHRHHGVAEPARRRRDPRRRLPDADLEDHHASPASRPWCWRRSAPSRSTWRRSPRRSAWAAKPMPIPTGAGSPPRRTA